MRLDQVPRTLCQEHPANRDPNISGRTFLFRQIHAGVKPPISERVQLFRQERSKHRPKVSVMRAAQIARAKALKGKRPNWKTKKAKARLEFVPAHLRSDTHSKHPKQPLSG